MNGEMLKELRKLSETDGKITTSTALRLVCAELANQGEQSRMAHEQREQLIDDVKEIKGDMAEIKGTMDCIKNNPAIQVGEFISKYKPIVRTILIMAAVIIALILLDEAIKAQVIQELFEHIFGVVWTMI